MSGRDVRTAAAFLLGLPVDEAVQVIGRLPSRARDAVVTEIAAQRRADESEQSTACCEFAAAGRFEFLSGMKGTQLAAIVSHERPQTIAAVAAQLPKLQAAALLAHLSPTVTDEVVRRIAALAPLARIVLCDLEEGLRGTSAVLDAA